MSATERSVIVMTIKIYLGGSGVNLGGSELKIPLFGSEVWSVAVIEVVVAAVEVVVLEAVVIIVVDSVLTIVSDVLLVVNGIEEIEDAILVVGEAEFFVYDKLVSCVVVSLNVVNYENQSEYLYHDFDD